MKNITNSNSVYYTGRFLVYKHKICGIRILPRIFSIVGNNDRGFRYSETNSYDLCPFKDKDDCDHYLDEFIEDFKRTLIKTKRIL